MSVTVRKAAEDDLYSVYQLLSNSSLNSAWLPFEARKRMFRQVWGGTEDYYGYVMVAGDEVVGFLGTLFTEREVRGQRHKFCELHSWYVKDEYRKESMRLFLPVMSMRKATLLNYTPTGLVYEISKKFGFEDLEKRLLMFLPIPTPRTFTSKVRIEKRKNKIIHRLEESDRRIFLDHGKVDCHHYLVTRKNSDDYCYIILKKMWLKKFLPFGRVIYASNMDLFMRGIDKVKMTWGLRLGVPFVVVDHESIGIDKKPPFTRALPRKYPSVYKSKELTSEDLKPPLYSLPLLLGYRLH